MGFKATNVAGAAFTYGATKARVKAQFREGRKGLSRYEQGASARGRVHSRYHHPDVAAMAKANTPTSLGGYDFGHHAQ
jgi:hypothetical protein